MILESETPKVEGFSPDFNDLISRLLVKDPIKRMHWDELKEHPFWEKRDTDREYNFSKMKVDYPEQT